MMDTFNLNDHSHRRLNILTNEWVQVSPHRSKRPWQGKVEDIPGDSRPAYDPGCYLCPGNERAGGAVNPAYGETFVFQNDFAALQEDIPAGVYEKGSLLKAKSERGLCKVICFSPRHDLTLPEMEIADIERVVRVWKKEYEELGALDFINHVQIFENKGEVMGCSNPHPHGQIWAQESIPVEPARELENFRRYYAEHGRTILSDYLAIELEERERVIFENESFVVLVPFWAIWPFETMIISKRAVASLADMTDPELKDLAEAMQNLLIRYDNLFEISFPYSAGLHQAPTDGKDYEEWHFHMHFYPPLLRSAMVKKFMVGYEMLANPQRDITAELSAQRLRELDDVHYKKRR